MDSAKSQLADKLKTANNILVTVSRNPSVDQLAACIGLTLLLNKLGKHSAAVFSGAVPSTLEFLKPEDTLEKNTDSLRDFIIALDKSKADKLRYKVEDNVVRIFITPYRTSISQEDLEFSQGDFNVDVVIALGVLQQEDLDDAITAHGRILHDATVATINLAQNGELGSINWQDQQASSLSELVTELAQSMKGQKSDGDLFDAQIATALLTGIVAETNRFSNEKTTSQTMSASAALMAAGANQQLVATELGDKPDDNSAGNGAKLSDDTLPKSDDGTLDITHDDNELKEGSDGVEADSGNDSVVPALELPKPDFDEPETPETNDQPQAAVGDHLSEGPKLMTEAPTMGGVLTANTQPEGLDPSTDPLSVTKNDNQPQLLDHNKSFASSPDASEAPQPTEDLTEEVIKGFTPPPASWTPPQPTESRNDLTAPAEPEPKSGVEDKPEAEIEPETPASDDGPDNSQTLSEIETAVASPHLGTSEGLDTARDEVSRALNGSTTNPEPIQALNAQPLGDGLHPDQAIETPKVSDNPVQPGPMLADILSPAEETQANLSGPKVTDPTAPPPVPPPIPFQFGMPNSSQNQQ